MHSNKCNFIKRCNHGHDNKWKWNEEETPNKTDSGDLLKMLMFGHLTFYDHINVKGTLTIA